MVMHHLNSQEYALFWGYFVLEIIVTDCTHSKSAKFWLMYVPAPLECSILERTLAMHIHRPHVCMLSTSLHVYMCLSTSLSVSISVQYVCQCPWLLTTYVGKLQHAHSQNSKSTQHSKACLTFLHNQDPTAQNCNHMPPYKTYR